MSEHALTILPNAVVPHDPDELRAIISAIGMDIGKEVVHHIETMYPDAIRSCSSTFALSVRNCVHNEIIDAFDAKNVTSIDERLRVRKEFRRHMKAVWKKIRETGCGA